MSTMDTAIKLQIYLEQYKLTQAKALTKVVGELDRTIIAYLGGEELSSYSFPRNEQMLRQEKETSLIVNQTVIASYIKKLSSLITAISDVESMGWGNILQNPIPIVDKALSAPLAIDGPQKGLSVKELLDYWLNNATSSVFGAIRRGVFDKDHNSAIRQQIRGTKDLYYKDGILDTLRRSAFTISNTIVQHVASVTRDAVLQGTSAKGVLWAALFEKNSCSRCKSMDAIYNKIGEGLRSPIHHNCRCMMVPIFNDTDMKGFNGTYYSWLKRQNPLFINQVLGASRGKDLVSGKLTSKRFGELQLERRFDKITLQQFILFSPSAFV